MKQFKSQICTTFEQSKRLLELGLKIETADCFHWKSFEGDAFIGNITKESLDLDDIPAWSLHRLMEIGDFVNVGFLNIDKIYECCIQMLEGQIRGGIINKEYINK